MTLTDELNYIRMMAKALPAPDESMINKSARVIEAEVDRLRAELEAARAQRDHELHRAEMFVKQLAEARAQIEYIQNVQSGAERTLRHENEDLQTRMTELEEAYAALVAINETNRQLAQDWKGMKREYRHADSVGCAVEWLGENAEEMNLLEANIMDRLTR